MPDYAILRCDVHAADAWTLGIGISFPAKMDKVCTLYPHVCGQLTSSTIRISIGVELEPGFNMMLDYATQK